MAAGLAALIALSARAENDQLLIGYKAGAAPKRAALAAHVARLGARVGETMALLRTTFEGSAVVRLSRTLSREASADLLRRIAAQPEIAYAEVDRFLYPQLMPNDRLFPQQWEMTGWAGSVRAPEAWDITTGSSRVVVAIADTGIRPHAELADRVLPGYDFVSADSDGVAFRGNDGDGRDPDASDPGDWVTSADLERLRRFPAEGDDGACGTGNSSWHGTRVASIVAARGNNGNDVAGLNWNARILPIRVLGKCGERTSDVADGVAWAAGLSVPGIPDNPNPAQVINLSLGATGACAEVTRVAFRRALEAGHTRAIVIAAGNSARNFRDFTPANCPNALPVAAIGRSGELASYSNFGSVAIAAPGGNAGNGGTAGLILAASNAGSTAPTSDIVAAGQGTSFASPMVAGVISLMLSANPDLSAPQIRAILGRTARPFVNNSCSYTRCGVGMLDALDAVRAAQTTRGEGGGKVYGTSPVYDATDLWYVPAEPGWGMSLTQHPGGQLVGVWYAYDAEGKPVWITLPGGVWLSETDFVGTLYRARGSAASEPWSPRTFSNGPAGSFKLSLLGADEIQFTALVNGEAPFVRTLRRLAF